MQQAIIQQIEAVMGGSGDPGAYPQLTVALAGEIASAKSQIEKLQSDRAAMGIGEPMAMIAVERKIEAAIRNRKVSERLFNDFQKWASDNAVITFGRLEIEREIQTLIANDGERRELEQRLRSIIEAEIALSNRVIEFNAALARDKAGGMRTKEKPIPAIPERRQPWPAIVARWPT